MMFTTKGAVYDRAAGRYVPLPPGSQETGIPPKSAVRLETLPDRQLVWEGRASGQFTYDIPLGRYNLRVVAPFLSRILARKAVKCCYDMEFLHGCTEEQWETLENLFPRMCKIIIGVTGTHHYCQFPGCTQDSSTRLEAAVHECEHFGVDPMKPSAVRQLDEASVQVVLKRPSVEMSEPTESLPLTPIED